MAGTGWSDKENDTIVADYFAMLARDIAGEPYNKAEHRRVLIDAIGRSVGSVEYKHQNISAVLIGFGEDWIPGYKPAFNYQAALEDVVWRWLGKHPEWSAPDRLADISSIETGFRDVPPLWIEPAPAHRNAPPPHDLKRAAATARKFDIAARDAANRALGRAGELRVFEHERATLGTGGRPDLARKVRWVSEEDGDGAGYDIASFDSDGRDRLLEVKTTNGWERTPFHITRNELAVAEDRRDVWCLMRLFRFRRGPRAFEIRPPLDAHVELTPTSFQAHII